MSPTSHEQLSLFDLAALASTKPASPDDAVWSHSRRTQFERCLLQYYFAYYGASSRTAKFDTNKQQLRFLKDLSNRHERTGSILHLAIATYLRQVQRGSSAGFQSIAQWARRIFSADRTFSRQYDGQPAMPSTAFPPVLLREYYYHQRDAEQMCDEAEARLIAALQTFSNGSAAGRFRFAAQLANVAIEHPFKLHLGYPPGRLEGMVDLAFSQEGQVTVADWKLGHFDGLSDSLQLGVYALWAGDHFDTPPDEVRLFKVFLADDRVVEYPVSQALLAATRARVSQDIERMAIMHPYGVAGRAEAFTPCAQVAVCAGCPFQGVCPEGRQFLNA